MPENLLEERDVIKEAKDLSAAARRKEEAFALEHRNAHAAGVAFDGDGCFLPGLGGVRRCFHCGVLIVDEDVCKRCIGDGKTVPARPPVPLTPKGVIDRNLIMAKELNALQEMIGQWAVRNFPCPQPGRAALRCTLGVCEEAGELAAALIEKCGPTWMAIPGYEGFYEVSNHGRVRRIAGGKGAHPHCERKLTVGYDGYMRVALSRGSKKDLKIHLVHRLVASAFLGQIPTGWEVNHKDGVKGNNVVWNLELVLPADNQRHAIALGLRRVRRHEEHHMAKISQAIADSMRDEYGKGGTSLNKLARKHGVSKKLVLLVLQNKIWVPDTGEMSAAQRAAPLQEAVGRLAHAILKREQGIRGTAHEHAVAARDAIGDICVYLMDLCHREGWYFGAILQEVSAKVLKRDWTKDKLAGGERQGAVESGGCAEAPFQPPSQPSRISER